MPRIYVEFSGLDQIGVHCKSAASKVDSIQKDFQRTVRQLDWDIRCEADINRTAKQISGKLNRYSEILDKFRWFIEKTNEEYIKLDKYGKINLADKQIAEPKDVDKLQSFESGIHIDFGWEDIIKSFGNAGSLFGIINNILGAKSWVDWGNVGVSTAKTISSISKSYNNYNKIGRAIGATKSRGYFWRKFFGLNKVGYASTASSPSVRFYNNLHNKTSPYRLNGIFDSFTGKKGTVSAAASWANVALSGVNNWFDNIEEQENSNGTMSTGRVIAETVSETVIDTVVTAAGSAVGGAAIATVTGAVAAPVVVTVATGFMIAAINTGVEAFTGKSATEWVSDAILDTAVAVGATITNRSEANWFGKLSFA